jgi:hypothetical protein
MDRPDGHTALVTMYQFHASYHTLLDVRLIGGRLVKNATRLSRPQALLSQASALSGRGHFLQIDAHREELCLLYPRVLDREERRYARVTLWRSHARRSSSVCSTDHLPHDLGRRTCAA